MIWQYQGYKLRVGSKYYIILLQYLSDIMSYKTNPKVYMDIRIGASDAGRVFFQLFMDLTPKTAQNFRGLCTGEYGKTDTKSHLGLVKLDYNQSKIHKIGNGYLQGGDITGNGGTGGYSIYGRTFVDQNFSRRHSYAGLLSMANTGRNSNSSQFIITLKACPQLDDKNVVFGQVIEGMEFVRKMAKVPVDKNDKPKIAITILDAGEVDYFKNFLDKDPFKKSIFEELRQKKRQLVQRKHKIRKLMQSGIDPNEPFEKYLNLQKCQAQIKQIEKKQQQLIQQNGFQNQNQQQQKDQKQEEAVEVQKQVPNELKKKLKPEQYDRFLDIKLKLNEAQALNAKAVQLQQIQENDASYHKLLRKQQYYERKKHQEEQLKAKGISEDKLYMTRIAIHKPTNQKKQEFGWNVFTQQALYKAYDKRCRDQQQGFDKQLYQKMKKDPNFKYNPSQDAMDRMAADVQKQIQSRGKFSRRRMHDEGEIVSYVNERNRLYNMKLDRSFGKYNKNIEAAMEMGNQKFI